MQLSASQLIQHLAMYLLTDYFPFAKSFVCIMYATSLHVHVSVSVRNTTVLVYTASDRCWGMRGLACEPTSELAPYSASSLDYSSTYM